jgi:hypothetical protein
LPAKVALLPPASDLTPDPCDDRLPGVLGKKHRHLQIWDRCHDFKNIFAENFSKNIGVFCSNYC